MRNSKSVVDNIYFFYLNEISKFSTQELGFITKDCVYRFTLQILDLVKLDFIRYNPICCKFFLSFSEHLNFKRFCRLFV
jgi:hypothetical protein